MATQTTPPLNTVSGHTPAQEHVEQLVGNLLRIGVLIAAAVALIGAIVYLAHYGGTRPSYHVFRGEPTMLRHVASIALGAATLQSHAIIQLGIVLLIATPVARVALTVIAFAVRKDWMYVVISAIVLGLLTYSLFAG